MMQSFYTLLIVLATLKSEIFQNNFKIVLYSSNPILKIESDSREIFKTKLEYLSEARWAQSLITFDENVFNVSLSYANVSKGITLTPNYFRTIYPQVLSFQKKIQAANSVIDFLCYKDPKTMKKNGCCIVTMNNVNINQFHTCKTDENSSQCIIKVNLNNDQVSSLDEIQASYISDSTDGKCDYDSIRAKSELIRHIQPIYVKSPRHMNHKLDLREGIFLDYANKKLSENEIFKISAFIVENSPKTEFYLTCQIPEQTFIEFQYLEPIRCETKVYNLSSLQNCSPNQKWSVEVVKAEQPNLLHFKAKRSSQKTTELLEDKHFGIFRIVFKVLPMLDKRMKRSMPRLMWSLNRGDSIVEPSVPGVTRLFVRSSKVKKILVQLKEKFLIKFGQEFNETRSSIKDVMGEVGLRVLGLSYDDEILNVTNEATCYSSKDSILRFRDNSCQKPYFHERNTHQELVSRIEDVQVVAKYDDLDSNAQLTMVLIHADSINLSIVNKVSVAVDGGENVHLIRPFYKTASRIYFPPVHLQAYISFPDGDMITENNQKISVDIQKFINVNLFYHITPQPELRDIHSTSLDEWISVNRPMSVDDSVKIQILDHSQLLVTTERDAEISFKLDNSPKILFKMKFLSDHSGIIHYNQITLSIFNNLLINWNIREKVVSSSPGSLDVRRSQASRPIHTYTVVEMEICPLLKSSGLTSIFSQQSMSNKCSATGQINNEALLDLYPGRLEYSFLSLALTADSGATFLDILDIFKYFKQAKIESPFSVRIINHLPDVLKIYLPSEYSNWFIVRDSIKGQPVNRRRSIRIQDISLDIFAPAIMVMNNETSFSGKLLDISIIPNNRDGLGQAPLRTQILGNVIGAMVTEAFNSDLITNKRGSNDSMNADTNEAKPETETRGHRLDHGETKEVKPKNDIIVKANNSINKQHMMNGLGRKNGRRIPPLELGMYVLLGFSILVALVFSVNCGAIVARYKWERRANRNGEEANGLTTSSSPQDKQKKDKKLPVKDTNFVWLQNKGQDEQHQQPTLSESRHYAEPDVTGIIDSSEASSDDEINFAFKATTPRRTMMNTKNNHQDCYNVNDNNEIEDNSTLMRMMISSEVYTKPTAKEVAHNNNCPQCKCPCQTDGLVVVGEQPPPPVRTILPSNVDEISKIACSGSGGCEAAMMTMPIMINQESSYSPQVFCKACCYHQHGQNVQMTQPRVPLPSLPVCDTSQTLKSARLMMEGSRNLEMMRMMLMPGYNSSTTTRRQFHPSCYTENPMQASVQCHYSYQNNFHWQLQHEQQQQQQHQKGINFDPQRQMFMSGYSEIQAMMRPSSMLTIDSDLSAWGHELTSHYHPEEIREYIENLKESNA